MSKDQKQNQKQTTRKPAMKLPHIQKKKQKVQKSSRKKQGR